MSKTKNEIMKQEIAHHISSFGNYLIDIGTNMNNFYYDMLNNFSVSIWIPVLSDIMQHLHILYYPFKENVSFYLLILIIFFS